jgi:signal peptidase I
VTKTKKSFASSALELVAIVVVALGLALGIQAFIVKPYRIPSASMLPTLHINQRVLVNRIGTHFGSPSVGDIIVFTSPKITDRCADPSEGVSDSPAGSAKPCGVAQGQSSGVAFIKRVVGLPGDRIAIRQGHVYRNGVREKDPYINQCVGGGACDFPGTITIPKDEYFMMGDNRGDSDDSRYWGPIKKQWIIGRAFFTYWPPDRIGFL